MNNNSEDPRLPNEILVMIIDNLANDLSSLYNISLVCRDLSVISRACIFRKLRLAPKKRIERFRSLLSDPKSKSISGFVRSLDMSLELAVAEDLQSSVFILEHLPSLTDIAIESAQTPHLEVMKTCLGNKLRELWIYLPYNVFEGLQDLLISLTTLKLLSLSGCNGSNMDHMESALILPGSLETLSLTLPLAGRAFHSIGLGIEVACPPALHTLYVEFDWSERYGPQDRSVLWRGLGLHVKAVVDIRWRPSSLMTELSKAASAMFRCMQGFRAPQLTFSCSQSPFVVPQFARYISNLPRCVREIFIDIDAKPDLGLGKRPLLDSDVAAWSVLDTAMSQRHGDLNGLMRICFRCTVRTRDARYTISSESTMFASGGKPDRTILDRIPKLLPLSNGLGIIEIDRDTHFFEF
ncbi:hypothetical protein BDP27DRAFT_1447008 [Rhodocollybia butyracea]|uniref:F-box domain-containing protein n=1 Tax=Rhodocollybia butyracea TaxID=206335 RepID=A0A9P5U8V6_9AGAR|nr:hypothetical protein BDP27DRAFT_1447008 [Rhodocollybia butyracea]